MAAMGTVYRKGGKLYIGVKTATGRWKYIATGYSVGDEANARRMLARLQKDEQPAVDPNRPTVSAYAKGWLKERRKLGLRNVDNDESRLDLHILPVLGGLPLGDVRVRHLKDLVLHLRSGSLAPRTIHSIYGLTHKLFQDAVVDELIEHNPCQLDKRYLGAKKDKDPTWRAGAIFTRDELEQLIGDERIPQDRRMVYALEGLAGLRHGEMAGLRWEHLDPRAKPLGLLLVAYSYDQPTKAERPRRVPVHPTLAALLDSWKAGGWPAMMGRHPKPGDLIMPSRLGTMRDKKVAWEGRQRDFEALSWRRRRGHDLRRTFISLARADGARPDILKLITHGPSGDMISIYTEMPWEALCEQVACLRVALPDRQIPLRIVASPVAGGGRFTTALLPVPLSDEELGDPTGIRRRPNPGSPERRRCRCRPRGPAGEQEGQGGRGYDGARDGARGVRRGPDGGGAGGGEGVRDRQGAGGRAAPGGDGDHEPDGAVRHVGGGAHAGGRRRELRGQRHREARHRFGGEGVPGAGVPDSVPAPQRQLRGLPRLEEVVRGLREVSPTLRALRAVGQDRPGSGADVLGHPRLRQALARREQAGADRVRGPGRGAAGAGRGDQQRADEPHARAGAPMSKKSEPVISHGKQWVKIDSPKPWCPTSGEVLVAKYLSRTTRPGHNGTSYGVVTLGTEDGAVTISGVVISRLFDVAGDLEYGTMVRVQFKGEQLSGGTGRVFKDYDLWVEKGARG